MAEGAGVCPRVEDGPISRCGCAGSDLRRPREVVQEFQLDSEWSAPVEEVYPSALRHGSFEDGGPVFLAHDEDTEAGGVSDVGSAHAGVVEFSA